MKFSYGDRIGCRNYLQVEGPGLVKMTFGPYGFDTKRGLAQAISVKKERFEEMQLLSPGPRA